MNARITLAMAAEKIGETLLSWKYPFTVERLERLLSTWKPRYNILPGEKDPSRQPLILHFLGQPEDRYYLGPRFWGYTPADPDYKGPKPINARMEKLMDGFWRADFPAHRCLFLVSGLFEPDERATPKPQSFISRRDGGLFALAAIYRGGWIHKGKVVDHPQFPASVAIVTAPASPFFEETIGHRRMPLILTVKQGYKWLNPTAPIEDVLFLLGTPKVDDELQAWRVDREKVNKGLDSPDVMTPI